MNFFKKIFGSNSSPAKSNSNPAPVQPPASQETPDDQTDMIRVYDEYGRELLITRQQWRDNVLIGTIEKNWDDANRIAGFIIQSLQDNFFDEMIKPAERLMQLEPDSERSAVLLAIVYLKTKRLDDSERILQEFISKHGESGVILTNLAKVYADRGDEPRTMETLWRGLQLDPNQDNGLGWYEVIHREQGGETAGLEALRRIAEIPGSWRAQMWLARAELKNGRLDEAIRLYQEALAHAGKPAPTDLLMQMSGDLGNTGHLPEILLLVRPQFEPSIHGLSVGNNLIKAQLELGHHEDARHILDQLYALKRPDWKETLGYWDTELAKARIGAENKVSQKPLSVTLMVDQGPVWLNAESPAGGLFADRIPSNLKITLLGCTAEVPDTPQHVEIQLSDAPGRMSRALPLYLAEQLEFRCGAQAQTLVPWIVEPSSGFVLSTVAWSDEEAVKHTQQCERSSDYVIVLHLIAKSDPWQVTLRLVRISDGVCVRQITEPFQAADPAPAIKRLTQTLLNTIESVASIQQQATPKNYTVPDGTYFPLYLLRLEQLLAVRCSSMDNVPPGFLSGEREIIDGNLQLALNFPSSVNVRLLLAQTLRAMKHVRPDILPEFSERISLLQSQKPLTESAQSVVQEVIDEAFAT